ncbi:MAG: glycosyl hydrolase family 43 [Clostridiales bacterium]|jgi:hypothetical protein|nr:glycosyl hydrolase family 43 [Clostridiales bacterium]HOB63807.1 glycosyl hydrolase family 43 [Clostridia bacterium]HOK81135.1 glycosyl hydrolase family 43 [Clostridia bacterium]HOL60254.1 glycosyl hydrolase family 43 [Clostridia bacterium]HPO53787.1 glycosyl hydrolase family 43 [Clostridia bacterium]
MLHISFEKLEKSKFRLYEKNPVVNRFGLSTVVADPSVLTPEQSHDKKWHMFCHTLMGVYRYESEDGIAWQRAGKVLGRAMRPDINYIEGVYYLYYERLQPLPERGLSLIGGKWFSEIYVVTSKDLVTWSKPKKVIGANRDYMRFGDSYSVSNPFLMRENGKNRLYFSAGLTYIKDCGFSEPTYISYAESGSLTDGFVPLGEPILKPDENSKYLNICCGCIKVYRLKDCYIGLQNGIYKDGEGNSHSAIMLLKSDDGKSFEFVKPLVEPQICPECEGRKDWMAQYVYACCLCYSEGRLYLYFNARDKAHALKGREHIGVAIAEL